MWPRTWWPPAWQTGLEVIVSYAIGVAEPISVSVETFDTNHLDPTTRFEDLVRENISTFAQARSSKTSTCVATHLPPNTAAYGHFGRTDVDLPWERTDKADMLRKKAGL